MAVRAHKETAVVVLPGAGIDDVGDAGLRRWLALGDNQRRSAPCESLHRVAAVLGQPPPEQGLAALRYLGQTGERPDGWLAAADPVYLEPRLDHLGLYHLPLAQLARDDVDALFAELAEALGETDSFRFRHVDTRGYLFAREPLAATADLSPAALDGMDPAPFMPVGTAAQVYQRLSSEVQMVLHRSPVQERRQQAGLPPVNALWLWGGGDEAGSGPRFLPPLFADDPLLAGYWLAGDVNPAAWPGDIAACAEQSGAGFVAMPADFAARGTEGIDDRLEACRRLLGGGDVASVVLLFGDGTSVVRKRSHRFRIWRRAPAAPAAPGTVA